MSTVSFIPFSQYTPDGGRLRNPGLLNAENVGPTEAEGFTPIPTINRNFGRTSWAPLIPPLPAGDSIQKFALGGAVVVVPAVVPAAAYVGGFYKVFVGSLAAITGYEDQVIIYEWTVEEDGDVTAFYSHRPLYPTGESVQLEGWFFQVYGNNLVAVAGHDATPKLRLDASDAGSDFIDLFSSSPFEPKAKFVACIGLHLLLANGKIGSDVYANRVWWSETDNIRYFSEEVADPEKRTSFQDLHDDCGPITGIIGAADYAYVAKAGCWYRMDAGGPFDYQFKPFGLGMGTIYPHSICTLGDSIYYWSRYGPAVIRPGLEPEPLGEGVFKRTLKDGSWVIERGLGPIPGHPPHLMNAVVDAENELVCWAYNVKNGMDESDPKWIYAVDTMFIYNARHGRAAVRLNWFETDELTENGKEDGYLIDDFPSGIFQRDDDETYPEGFLPAIPFAAGVQPNLDGFAQWAPLLRIHWILLSKGYEYVDPGPDGINFPALCYAYGDNTASPLARFRTGFVRIDERGGDVKIHRVRVIASSNAGAEPPELEVRVYSMRLPYGQPMVDPEANHIKAVTDERGWFTFPQTPVAPLHQFDVRIKNPTNVGEIEGIEVEWELTGR